MTAEERLSVITINIYKAEAILQPAATQLGEGGEVENIGSLIEAALDYIKAACAEL